MNKIVLFGDSIIDTFDFMGQGFLELKHELDRLQANNSIQLINHGVGSTNIALGLERITKPYHYQARGRRLKPVLKENPSLVVVGSFAYNHWSNSPEDIKKYIDCHRKIIELLKEKTKIILLATISPNKDKFVQGVLGLGWDKKRREQEYNLVKKYFKEFIGFAKSTNLPFLNLFEKSLTPKGTGDLTYISNVDYIHLSYEGRVFIAKNLAPMILKQLITLTEGR